MERRFRDDEMLTARQVAERLNMSPKSIHYYRKKGSLPAYKEKVNRYVFCGEDLNRLINRHMEMAKEALVQAFDEVYQNNEVSK